MQIRKRVCFQASFLKKHWLTAQGPLTMIASSLKTDRYLYERYY